MVSRDPRIKELYSQVTAAILRAEHFPAWSEAYRATFVEVSLLEEQIAHILPVTELEGDIARRGAINAALSALQPERARVLAMGYLLDPLLTPEQRSSYEALHHQAMVEALI